MDEVDRRFLAFLGAHRFVTGQQIAQFLHIDEEAIDKRQAALVSERLVRCECLRAGWHGLVRVTCRGLAAIGSRLAAPGFDLTGYRHEIGVVWLWMAGWDGGFGEAERVLSAREMQALDRAAIEDGRGGQSFAVPAGIDGDGAVGVLYPDVLMVFSWGRGAVHLLGWPHRRLDLD